VTDLARQNEAAEIIDKNMNGNSFKFCLMAGLTTIVFLTATDVVRIELKK
jgi:hypothetical protein